MSQRDDCDVNSEIENCEAKMKSPTRPESCVGHNICQKKKSHSGFFSHVAQSFCCT